MLKKVNILEVSKNENPKYVKSQLVKAERDGQEFPWEMTVSHDSVHVLVYNVDTFELFFVKQVRIPVLVNDPSNDGHVVEACAGLIDKDIDIIEIAREEVLEELGYDIPVENLTEFKQIKSGVGHSGRTAHIFFAEVSERFKVSNGGGLDSEDIEVIRIPFDEVEDFFFNQNIHTDGITMFLVTYWLRYTGR